MTVGISDLTQLKTCGMIKYSSPTCSCTNYLELNQKTSLFGMENNVINFEPLPLKEQENGKKLWIINGYRVWAENYQQALELAAIIDKL